MSACPICGGDGDRRLVSTDRNRGLGDELFEYRMCRGCATLFLANVPEDLGRYYPPEYYALATAPVPNRAEREKVALLRRFVDGGALVEVGPGAGGFAAQAARSGFDVRTIEMDERACRHLRETVGVQAVHSDEPHRALQTMAPARAIVLWHVLEHLLEPMAMLRSAAANLDPGGVLVIAVPNPGALGLRVLGERWPHIDAPRHLALVPAATLVAQARGMGLEPLTLTASDFGARGWNAFGWQHALLTPSSGALRRRAAFYAGSLVAIALARVEGRGLRGSAYTVAFRKHGGS